MDNRKFKAHHWLGPKATGLLRPSKTQGPLLPPLPEGIPSNKGPEGQFALSQYVVPSWKGRSLVTKESLKLKKLLGLIITNVNSQLDSLQGCNRSLKFSLFNEFLEFITRAEKSPEGLDNLNVFWSHFIKDRQRAHKLVGQFKSAFATQVATIYLYKCRFLMLLVDRLELDPRQYSLFNPDSCFRRFFRTGSSTELRCGALGQNQFSWYRPDERLKGCLDELKSVLLQIDQTEVIKVCNIEIENRDEMAESYSHSLSHEEFGKLLNQLILDFPFWLDRERSAHMSCGQKVPTRELNALKTLFLGDFQNSLAKAHWLAQTESLKFNWNQVICPQFAGENGRPMQFVGMSNELLFLTFLLTMAEVQRHDPIDLICHLYRRTNSAHREKAQGQISIFEEMVESGESQFTNDRIVLGLLNLPKKNPHHYICQKIQGTEELLAKNGRVVVLTNQKIFVPSQSERVEQLLKKFEIEVQLSFEGLRGKGEVPSFVYLLKRREVGIKNEDFLTLQLKETCSSIQLEGQILQFQKFGLIVESLFQLFQQKSPTSTTFFQRDLLNGQLSFHFHQDAIIDGKLLSATGSDKNKMAHPHFFKNLTKNCVPFDLFFSIDMMEAPGKESKITGNILGVQVQKQERYPLLLVVNYSDITDISIELTSMDVFKAKFEELGQAYFQYFGLAPKRSDININSFREFFNSTIGKQIIQLSLSGKTTKLKSKINSLLIPKFFLTPREFPTHIPSALDLLKKQSKDFLGDSVLNLVKEINEKEVHFDHFIQEYPWKTYCLLSELKHEILKAKDQIGSTLSGKSTIDFNHPIIREKIIELDVHRLYPSNDDVYVLPKISTPQDIHKTLTHTQLENLPEGPRLILFSQNQKIVEIYSDSVALQFLDFILKNAPSMSVSQVIQNIRLPSVSGLVQAVKHLGELETGIEKLFHQISEKSEQLISVHVAR